MFLHYFLFNIKYVYTILLLFTSLAHSLMCQIKKKIYLLI